MWCKNGCKGLKIALFLILQQKTQQFYNLKGNTNLSSCLLPILSG